MVLMEEDKESIGLQEDEIHSHFYADYSGEDFRKAKEKLCLEPLLPSGTPVYLSDEKFGSVPRVYIEGLKDKAIPIQLQRAMYKQTICEQVITMDSDHSPFFSHPKELTSHLIQLTLERAEENER
ncbi:hypothetical protein [Brevibacillus reuszeri]|uniref:hypothetical protein n=1 Tax=Brevibacillus reuszeri TaxID=54915 RepID=UPI003D1D3185